MPAKPRSSRRILVALILAAALVYLFVDFRTYKQSEWSEEIKDKFYFADQGSKLLPSDWFVSLSVPAGDARFTANLDRLGFIPPRHAFKQNPYNLPIGFAAHSEPDGQEWIGLTCAACHTGRVVMEDGRDILIEGGQSLLDLDSFFAGMVHALEASLTDEQFAGFAQRVNESAVKYGRKKVSNEDLRAAATRRLKILQERLRYNTPTLSAGFGRVDAFGQIFNQVGFALHNPIEKLPPPDAPASYPFVWDTPKHKRVQWNGSAPNLGVQRSGSMLRNIGEVIGVFGEVRIESESAGFLPKYENSANHENLKLIEEWITSLASPKWPGKIDLALAAQGKDLYDKECASCHAVVDPSNTPVPTPVTMTPVADVQTDPVLATDFLKRTLAANALTGKLTSANPRNLFQRFDAEAPASTLTVNAAVGARAFHTPPFLSSAVDAIRGAWEGLPTIAELSAYKARPLNGVWATAPYLHNGSILTLWEVIVPKDRKPKFCVGTALYDSKLGGYMNDCNGRHSELDTTKAGNHNSGHTYGQDLKESQSWALLEYLKTL